ncbi:MAG: class I SAM-dependent methyltransferase [Candidatus Omnitrophica bacterium]|nr:class I SAM-dependent methyltransferase [Candidatus Omnitrophota bacterium]
MIHPGKSPGLRDLQAEYDRIFAAEGIRDEERGYAWVARQVLSEVTNPQDLADVACGGGYFLEVLSRLTGGRVRLAGTDFSGQALALARQSCGGAGYALSASEALPFKDRTFDAVTCLGSLEHFLDIGQALREIRRIARPGAKIFILVPNIFWYKDLLSVLFTGGRLTRNQIQERFASLNEWKETFAAQGLEVLRVRKYNGIARSPMKQRIKDAVIPLKFSYHFLFVCAVNPGAQPS